MMINTNFLFLYFLFITITTMNQNAVAQIIFNDDFDDIKKWNFISDNVMGGVSSGKISIKSVNRNKAIELKGKVSTENNGGFIQARRNLRSISLKEAKYIKIIARGNNEKYYIHLRTSRMIFPWQYYQIGFNVDNGFKEFILPLSQFKTSGLFLAKTPKAKNITSIAIVAFGKDHNAELDVSSISIYK